MYLISPDVKNLAMWRFHVAGCLPSVSSQLLNGGENKHGAFWCCQMFRTSFGAATGWNSRNAMEPGTQMYPVHHRKLCTMSGGVDIIRILQSNIYIYIYICALSCVHLYYCFSVRSPIRWAIELGKLVLHCGCLRMFATIIFDDALWCWWVWTAWMWHADVFSPRSVLEVKKRQRVNYVGNVVPNLWRAQKVRQPPPLLMHQARVSW